jgi:hypothetical protein
MGAMMRANGDLPKVLGATLLCLSIGLLTDGRPRTLFFGIAGMLLWVSLFLLFAELSWGLGSLRHWRFALKPRDRSHPDNRVLRVMREVMNVRPEPFSGAPSEPTDPV